MIDVRMVQPVRPRAVHDKRSAQQPEIVNDKKKKTGKAVSTGA